MKKNKQLSQWLWKWHFIAGIISLPFVLILSITGGIYLFKDKVETPLRNEYTEIKVENQKISFEKQLQMVEAEIGKKPDGFILPKSNSKATEFITGRFSHKKSIFVNPYTQKITGKISPSDTWMHTVRKLHGELLGGKIGTKIIELVASWMVVLILTGIFIFWPKNNRLSNLVRVRLKKGKHILYKDLHSVLGFWLSLLLLLTLAGGFPWTDVFGANFKTLQKITNTGFPKEWSGKGFKSINKDSALTIDQMITIANKQNLKGIITIDIPKNKKSVFSVHNQTFPLKNQYKLHFDQYSGKLIKKLTWADVGILMRGRMWVMAFHQGQLGTWNFILMLFVALVLTFISVSGLISYIYRKKPGSLSIPKVPEVFKISYSIIVLMILLGIIFPLFGISLVLISAFSLIKKTSG